MKSPITPYFTSLSTLRGKRGQVFLKDLLAALDAMPDKKLIARYLEDDGCVCAMGALGLARGIDMTDIDPEDYNLVASEFSIAPSLAQEVMYMNDGYPYGFCEEGSETPEERFIRVRARIEFYLRVSLGYGAHRILLEANPTDLIAAE